MSGGRVNVVARRYAYGLKQSRTLVTAALGDDAWEIADVRSGGWRERLVLRVRRTFAAPADVNVFLETIVPEAFPMARRQAFVPNQEWFFRTDVPLLAHVDAVICKTRHAERIFSALGCRVAYSSFTSLDRRCDTPAMRREFLLLGGKQPLLARRVLALWALHPEWPRLTITTGRATPLAGLANVRQFRRFLPDETIAHLQNEHRFHLCMTRAEGFGHKLNEGLSCGAIVVATDGAPMNEVIAPDRGMLVRAARSEPLGLGTAFDFDEADLERTIEKCVRLAPREVDRLSRAAREWFDQNDRFFRREFPRIVRELV